MLYRPGLTSALLLSIVISGAASAHEDDPKILDRQPPYQGPGFRRASLQSPGTLFLGGGAFDSSGVQLLSWVPLGELGNPASGADCWGYVSASGREYALIGHDDGASVVEISNPYDPQVIANLSGPQSLWRDVKVYQDYAYVVTEGGGGLRIYDLSGVDNGSVPLAGNVVGGTPTSTHNVAINEDSGYLYRTGGGDRGLRIYDLNADPINPPQVADWSTRYVHDAQIVTYTTGPYAGKEIAFAFSGFNGGWVSPGLDIIDVTDKGNLVSLANITYAGAAYSHQGWLSTDRQYLYLGDELDENGVLPTTTYVIDVSDLSNPFEVTSFTNGNQAIGHNIYTVGDVLFEANYRSGLRIFDASNPLAPQETAYFDTYPDNDSDGFNGLWSVYPYFPSGVVIGSDLERGLFVWRIGEIPLTFDFPNGLPTVVDPAGEDLAVTIDESTLGEYVSGSATLHLFDGGGWMSVPMTENGGNSFTAHFPPLACGTSFDYYFAADAASGGVWTSPESAPATLYSASAALGVNVTHTDDLEATSGWTAGVGGDTASTGIWTLVDPNGTGAQPEDDHTASGTQCWVTGQGTAGGSDGENDVDGGTTTLVTPPYDLSGRSSPTISYWRWYSNDQGTAANDDVLVIDISDDGVQWVNVETVGPAGPETAGGWYEHSVRVLDHVTLSSTVYLRFVAADLGGGSIVEAAIDDLQIVDLDCDGCGTVSNFCSTAPNSTGGGALIDASGSTSLAANNFTLNATAGAPGNFGLFFYGAGQIQTPFGDGFRCVSAGGVGTFRLNPALTLDALGDGSRLVDFTQPPASSGPGAIQSGDTWYFQFWYRDPAAGGSGFNLSDGLAASFCP